MFFQGTVNGRNQLVIQRHFALHGADAGNQDEVGLDLAEQSLQVLRLQGRLDVEFFIDHPQPQVERGDFKPRVPVYAGLQVVTQAVNIDCLFGFVLRRRHQERKCSELFVPPWQVC